MSGRSSILCALAFLIPGPAWADPAVLTHASGRVFVEGRQGIYPAPVFARLSEGDIVSLAGDARVRIVYPASGRQETWAGACEVEIRAGQGKSAGPGPSVKELPAPVAQQLARTPASGERARSGLMKVRSAQTADALEQLEAHYEALKRGASDDDTTPESFLLSGLIELRQYSRARALLAKLRADPHYKRIVEHFTPLARR